MNISPIDFENFVTRGYFTIRRTNSFWTGVWSDLTIEQTLMRSMKSCGGLTRGRGLTDSTLAKWLSAAGTCNTICSSLEEFCGVMFSSGEQHVDLRLSRQCKDKKDREKLCIWFEEHQPFPITEQLISLSTGIVGNNDVNCHQAQEVGTQLMAKMYGQNFAEVKISRKDKVLSLGAMTNSIKVRKETITVDPLMLFQRIAVAKKSDEDLTSLLEYELAPFPLALFKEGCMRKTNKASLYKVLPVVDTNINVKEAVIVIDGGFLLHRVKWQAGSTFGNICQQYICYVKSHYGLFCTVVFDGYNETVNSTKSVEQKRRTATKISVDINFDLSMNVTVQQEHFLGNQKNKSRLIEVLSQQMEAESIETVVAVSDADRIIVQCAIQKSTTQPIAIVGEDVDLVVLLMALTPAEKEIFYIKPGRGNVETKTFSSQLLQQCLFSTSILLIHSFSGCDTNSAIFRKSKVSFVKLFEQKPSLKEVADIFYDPQATHDMIENVGERIFLAMYHAPSSQNDLNRHRYSAFLKSTTKLKPDLPSLPPTKEAAKQHSFRAYLQVQEWLGNTLSPGTWGWRRDDGGSLQPTTTSKAPAPDNVLNAIFCRCTTFCERKCGCRRAGIKCSVICNCQGACTNAIPPDFYQDEDDAPNDEDEL